MRTPVFLFTLLLIPGAIARCKQEPKAPPPEILARYQADADRYCRAIVDCIKEDVAARLRGEPERREMVLKRMSQDLCLKGQYQLLGKLSVDPAPGPGRPYNPDVYVTYGQCARAVVEQKDCERRRATHKQFPACQRLRALH